MYCREISIYFECFVRLYTSKMPRKYTSFTNYFLLVVFATLSIIGIVHHPMWLDEVNCWLMVKSSHSLKELFQSNHYQGYLSLWEFLLYGLSRFTGNIFYVQVLNITISILAAYLFLRYAPFSLIIKICILFSYFFLFEYTLISRSYALTWLFLMVFCILFTRKKRNYPVIVFALIIIANTHLLSLVTSIPLFIITLCFMRKDMPNPRTIIGLGFLFIAGIAISLFNMMPPENATIFQTKESYFSFDHTFKALSFFVKGLYPIPDFTSFHFWNSNFIVVHIKWLSILLTVVILLIPCLIFHEKYFILLFFYIANWGIVLSLFALRITVGTRYMGYCFMILLVSLWLNTDERFSRKPFFAPKWLPAVINVTRFVFKPFLWSILSIQLLSGIYTYSVTLYTPFSEGKNAADFIKNNLPLHSKIIVFPTPSGPSISTYLNRELYYPQTGICGTFYPWTALPVIDTKELTRRIAGSLDGDSSNYKAIVFASNMDSLSSVENLIESKLDTGKYSIFKKVTMDSGMVKSENYVVYFLRKS